MPIYMTEDETKALTKVHDNNTNNEVIIPVFDIHSQTIGNGNGVERTTTHADEFHYHSDNSNIFKALLTRCSDDINNAFLFIPVELPQLTTISVYRHQIKLQNHFLASMAIIPIHGVTETAMKEKVEEKLLKVAGISRIDETRMAEQKGKQLVVTNKAYKTQVKREVERILQELTLYIMHPTYTQPRTISKEHQNHTFVMYTLDLQTATKDCPDITNVATLFQSQRNFIALFNALDNETYPKLPQKIQNYTNTPEEQDNNSLSNEIVTTWCDELQETLAETAKMLEKRSTQKKNNQKFI